MLATRLNLFPRAIPKRPVLELKRQQPTPEQLSVKPLAPKKRIVYPARRVDPIWIRLQQPKKEKRFITDVFYPPLPTTFKDGQNFSNYAQQPVGESDHHFPFKYYQITLKKGIIGLNKHTKKVVEALGLRRHQVIWRLVSPRSAGQVLKIKELVDVQLVNAIPPKPVYPTGFQKIGNHLLP